LWAITCYFNPVGFKRRPSNYRIFRANLAVPLVTVELSFDGRFELTDDDADILIQLSGGAVLWQKERLLNIAIQSVPQNAKNIAWLDCDVIFERPDWMHEAEQKLGEANVVQLYSELVDLGPDGYRANVQHQDVRQTRPCIVSAINSGGLEQLDAGVESGKNVRQPFSFGMAWAARRKIIEGHGLYDAMIVGGGDRAMVHAMYGQFEVPLLHLNNPRQEHYLRWARGYHREVAGKIGSVPGRIFHLWHGKFLNRNSRGRQRLLAGFDHNPDLDLRIGPNGAWHWARPRPDLEDFLRKYFLSRAEDEEMGALS
jgi:hypothetical protein